MSIRILAVTIAAAATVCTAALAGPQQAKQNFGKMEYDAKCAVCHGTLGKGDGYYKPYLTKSPPDITALSKSNQGVFPFQRAYEMVDGRGQAVAAHGTRDMPIWGNDYIARAREDYMDVPYDPEMYARTRILALLDYVERLQAK